MTAPRRSRARMRMADSVHTSAQRRQVTPCLSTQIFELERVAMTRGGCPSVRGAGSRSPELMGNMADSNARRDSDMFSTGAARAPRSRARKTALVAHLRDTIVRLGTKTNSHVRERLALDQGIRHHRKTRVLAHQHAMQKALAVLRFFGHRRHPVAPRLVPPPSMIRLSASLSRAPSRRAPPSTQPQDRPK